MESARSSFTRHSPDEGTERPIPDASDHAVNVASRDIRPMRVLKAFLDSTPDREVHSFTRHSPDEGTERPAVQPRAESGRLLHETFAR